MILDTKFNYDFVASKTTIGDSKWLHEDMVGDCFIITLESITSSKRYKVLISNHVTSIDAGVSTTGYLESYLFFEIYEGDSMRLLAKIPIITTLIDTLANRKDGAIIEGFENSNLNEHQYNNLTRTILDSSYGDNNFSDRSFISSIRSHGNDMYQYGPIRHNNNQTKLGHVVNTIRLSKYGFTPILAFCNGGKSWQHELIAQLCLLGPVKDIVESFYDKRYFTLEYDICVRPGGLVHFIKSLCGGLGEVEVNTRVEEMRTVSDPQIFSNYSAIASDTMNGHNAIQPPLWARPDAYISTDFTEAAKKLTINSNFPNINSTKGTPIPVGMLSDLLSSKPRYFDSRVPYTAKPLGFSVKWGDYKAGIDNKRFVYHTEQRNFFNYDEYDYATENIRVAAYAGASGLDIYCLGVKGPKRISLYMDDVLHEFSDDYKYSYINNCESQMCQLYKFNYYQHILANERNIIKRDFDLLNMITARTDLFDCTCKFSFTELYNGGLLIFLYDEVQDLWCKSTRDNAILVFQALTGNIHPLTLTESGDYVYNDYINFYMSALLLYDTNFLTYNNQSVENTLKYNTEAYAYEVMIDKHRKQHDLPVMPKHKLIDMPDFTLNVEMPSADIALKYGVSKDYSLKVTPTANECNLEGNVELLASDLSKYAGVPLSVQYLTTYFIVNSRSSGASYVFDISNEDVNCKLTISESIYAIRLRVDEINKKIEYMKQYYDTHSILSWLLNMISYAQTADLKKRGIYKCALSISYGQNVDEENLNVTFDLK